MYGTLSAISGYINLQGKENFKIFYLLQNFHPQIFLHWSRRISFCHFWSKVMLPKGITYIQIFLDHIKSSSTLNYGWCNFWKFRHHICDIYGIYEKFRVTQITWPYINEDFSGTLIISRLYCQVVNLKIPKVLKLLRLLLIDLSL